MEALRQVEVPRTKLHLALREGDTVEVWANGQCLVGRVATEEDRLVVIVR